MNSKTQTKVIKALAAQTVVNTICNSFPEWSGDVGYDAATCELVNGTGSTITDKGAYSDQASRNLAVALVGEDQAGLLTNVLCDGYNDTITLATKVIRSFLAELKEDAKIAAEAELAHEERRAAYARGAKQLPVISYTTDSYECEGNDWVPAGTRWNATPTLESRRAAGLKGSPMGRSSASAEAAALDLYRRIKEENGFDVEMSWVA